MQRNIQNGECFLERGKRSLRLLLTGLLLFASVWLGVAGCRGGDPAEGGGAKGIPESRGTEPAYSTQAVSARTVADVVKAVGTVKAYQEVAICPEVSGTINKIYCDLGDSVKRGDLLLEIDDETRRIALNQKKALLKKAVAKNRKTAKDAQKGSTLFQQGVISDSESDDIELEKQIADAELELARADVMKAEKDLRDTRIRAPFDGRIGLEDIEIGKMITSGQTLLTLMDITRVTIVVNISELEITKIAPGNVATIGIDGLPGKHLTGSVSRIGLKADESTRTFPVEILVINSDQTLLPGMVARVTITAAEPREVVTIPREAVRTVKGKTVAYTVREGEIEVRRLYLGKTMGDEVVVEEGLKEGDTLIVSGVIDPDAKIK